MRFEIFKALKDADGFISGEALSETLGVTRAALWKHIKAIQADGAQIESAVSKGYRLVSPPLLPRAEYVRAYLHSDVPVFFEERCASTNETAKTAARGGSLMQAAFIAGEQTAGKGRLGRAWVSKPGQGVYATMLIRPKIDPSRVSGITVMAAVAVCEAIEAVSALKPRIKWPNDVLLDDKKAVGILTESMVQMDGVEFAVCGIGINTCAEALSGEIVGIASAVEANPTVLAAAVIDGFFEAFEVFEQKGLAPFMEDFRGRNAVSGLVRLTLAGGSVLGQFIGYDDEGAILIETDGETKRFVAGEVSLRGERGYV